MFSPMFDGQYRSKPQVSLRGASRKEERVNLLARATEAREHRENVRRRQTAATTIQAFYRGHIHRQQLYSRLRCEFDEGLTLCSTPDHTLSLTRLMAMFYSQSKDHERLVKLCQKWLQYSRDLSSLTLTNSLCAYHLRELLARCCVNLTFDPAQNIAIPLRMLETFLSPSLYPQRRQIVGHFLSYLLKEGGYFHCLRTLLEHRVPPPDGSESHTHSPLTSSLLEYISRPFRSESLTTPLYLSLANELVAPPLTPHICHLLIPYLATMNLDLQRMLEALIVGLTSDQVAPSLELLYVMLELVHSQLKTLDQVSLSRYLKLVGLLLGHASTNHMTSHDLEDDEESMDEGEMDPLGTQEELEMCCVSRIVGDEVAVRVRQERVLSAELVSSLCSFCYQVILHQKSTARTHLFQRLALNSDLLAGIWSSINQLTVTRSFGDPVTCLHQLSKGQPLPPQLSSALIERLATFSTLFTLFLSTLHDAELYSELEGSHTPFTLSQIADMVPPLRDCYITLQLEKHLPSSYLGPKTTPTKPSVEEWFRLKTCVHNVLCALYERDCRRPFCPLGQWAVLPSLHHIPPDLFLENEGDEDEGTMVHASPGILKQAELLKSAPFVFSFIERVKFFTSLVSRDRSSSQGQHQEFLLGPSLSLTVRRDRVYEDAFAELAHGQDLRKKLRVSFVNAQGLDELGIDGGGLFREFLNDVLKTGFDPNRGYFSTTEDGLLYPNPQAPFITPDFAMHYQFLGSMLGKALYEGLLVELPFAGFFLCKLADRGQGSIGAYHLASLDAELYKHLLSLKHYHGNLEELDLTFTLLSDELGQTKVIELKPGGADIPVTRANCVEYIHLVSHYKLNVQLDRQFKAFRRGLSSVIPLHWLRLFNQNELQVLISGARVPIDVQDLRKNTIYSGEYKEDHSVIKLFWEVVGSLSETEKRQLLKFVTSCSRPPLLGFKELTPSFQISPGIGKERLPSASTCMNVLKLPQFQDAATLKSKLLYAIQSGAGFELS